MVRRRKTSSLGVTLATLSRFRRRRFWWRVAAAVACLAVLVALDQAGLLLAHGGDVGRYDGRSLLVDRVIDGDTLDVWAPDGASPTTRIRVWGIDTPEVRTPEVNAPEVSAPEVKKPAGVGAPAVAGVPAKPVEPFADEATAMTTQLVGGRVVTLRLESSRPRGRYGRVLAHVELPDGTLLADRLLTAGLARADDRWPHRHAERFGLLQRQAKRDAVGLWSLPPAPETPTETPTEVPAPPGDFSGGMPE